MILRHEIFQTVATRAQEAVAKGCDLDEFIKESHWVRIEPTEENETPMRLPMCIEGIYLNLEYVRRHVLFAGGSFNPGSALKGWHRWFAEKPDLEQKALLIAVADTDNTTRFSTIFCAPTILDSSGMTKRVGVWYIAAVQGHSIPVNLTNEPPIKLFNKLGTMSKAGWARTVTEDNSFKWFVHLTNRQGMEGLLDNGYWADEQIHNTGHRNRHTVKILRFRAHGFFVLPLDLTKEDSPLGEYILKKVRDCLNTANKEKYAVVFKTQAFLDNNLAMHMTRHGTVLVQTFNEQGRTIKPNMIIGAIDLEDKLYWTGKCLSEGTPESSNDARQFLSYCEDNNVKPSSTTTHTIDTDMFKNGPILTLQIWS